MRDMGDEIVLRSLQYVWTSYNNDDNYYTDVHDYYELPFERLTLITEPLLGCGHFGKVYYGTVHCNKTNRLLPVAVKMSKLDAIICTDDVSSQLEAIERQREALRTELNILAYIQRLNERQHPNLVRLIGTTTINTNQVYLMTEYCEYGSLENYLRGKYAKEQFVDEMIVVCNNDINCKRSDVTVSQFVSSDTENNCDALKSDGFITTSDLLSFAEQIASVMDYLSSKNILHRDVALRNIFLKSNMIVKLGDFGLSRHINDCSNTYFSSQIAAEIPVRYTALEALHHKRYSIESEVWTFGVVLWELFTFAQTMPYDAELPTFSVDQLKNFLSGGNRLTAPATAPPSVQKLMLATWSAETHQRPNFQTCQTTINKALDEALEKKTRRKDLFAPRYRSPTVVHHHPMGLSTKTTKITLLSCLSAVIMLAIVVVALSTLLIGNYRYSQAPTTSRTWWCRANATTLDAAQLTIVDWRNFSDYYYDRVEPIAIIRLHHSYTKNAVDARTALNNSQSSVHYIIETNGTIYQLVDESKRTWHSDEGSWQNITNIVGVSLEIVVVNSGDKPFTTQQMRAVALLCRQSMTKYHTISPNNIIGHSDSSPWEHDPSGYFDWQLLYLIVGVYPQLYTSNLTAIEQQQVLLQSSPRLDENVRSMQRQLQTFGYGVADSNVDGYYGPHTNALVEAFNRHFCPEVFIKEKIVNNQTISELRNRRWYRLSQERLDYLLSESS